MAATLPQTYWHQRASTSSSFQNMEPPLCVCVCVWVGGCAYMCVNHHEIACVAFSISVKLMSFLTDIITYVLHVEFHRRARVGGGKQLLCLVQ